MPVGPHRRTLPQERHAFGLTILAPSHPEVRRLQHDAVQPSLHGHKVWPSSWVLMDYLHQRGVPPRAHVLELGCGWGLVGIACAKLFQAQVTGLDADAHVDNAPSAFPAATFSRRVIAWRASERASGRSGAAWVSVAAGRAPGAHPSVPASGPRRLRARRSAWLAGAAPARPTLR